MIEESFYTYAFLRVDGTPYYIGKGKGGRAWVKRANCARKPPQDDSQVLILKKGLTEEEAFRHEIYMISVFGRKDLGTGILRNMTTGGEGTSGVVRNAEYRAKLSAAQLGKKHSNETKVKLSQINRGKSLTEETRRKISEAMRGRFVSNETRAKLSQINRGKNNPHFGKKHSLEHRAKISQALRGEKGPGAKTFIFTSPTDREFIVTGSFVAFCRRHEISWSTMRKALARNCCPPPKSGWLVRYAEIAEV